MATKYKPAFMKAPTPTKMQTYSFPNGNNGGMNMRVQADQIRDDQSPNMLNMCYREGVPSNRYAFDTEIDLHDASHSIKGLHTCTLGSTNYFLAVCNGKLLILD
jgi:hypothetical protein